MRDRELTETTIRTRDGRGLMRPTAAVTVCILGLLARFAQLYEIQLHAFIFLSNHAHILATMPNALAASCFVRDFKRSSSLALQSLTGWAEPVWTARTRPIPVLDEDAALGRLRYVLSNSVKEGLVAHPLDWPGPSSTRPLLEDLTVSVPARGRHPAAAIELAPLPGWATASREAYRGLVRNLVAEVTEEATQLRAGKPALGVKRILEADPFAPIALERRPAPTAHWTDTAAYAEFIAQRDAYTARYRAAARRLREKPCEVRFPAGSFLPSPGFEHGSRGQLLAVTSGTEVSRS